MNPSATDNRIHRQFGRFTVGHDDAGNWIVHDRDGVVGGLFADQASAIHFAMEESDHVPGAVCCTPDSITLEPDVLFGGRAEPGHGSQFIAS